MKFRGMNMNFPNIINIQKFSVHDGDGIRTTVFFKGCKLNCWWCHNPESQNFKPELMYNAERCTGCTRCIEVCPQHGIRMVDGQFLADRSKCDACGTCTDVCLNNAREICGRTYTIKELIREIEKDQMFYEESGGGVTLSGGESMLQDPEYMEQLCRQLHRKGFNIAVDTCGFAPWSTYERVLPYVDTFLYDIKLMDPERHKKYMGQDNTLILENLKKLSAAGANINLRIPLITPVNTGDQDIQEIISFLKENDIRIVKTNLLPYHNTGNHKYEKLGEDYKGITFERPSDERLEQIRQQFIGAGFTSVKIGG